MIIFYSTIAIQYLVTCKVEIFLFITKKVKKELLGIRILPSKWEVLNSVLVTVYTITTSKQTLHSYSMCALTYFNKFKGYVITWIVL